MKTFEGETVLNLKEASEKYDVPVHWLRRQIGKPLLPGGSLVRVVKFPADKNFYMFLSELEEIAKPRVYSVEYIKLTQNEYEADPEKEPKEDE